MPLLNKQKFVPKPIPDDLDPNEEIFYSKLTREIFQDYDEYFERTILCNSLVWTCHLTGKTGLTFGEAVESEEKALKTIKQVPQALEKAIVYLINSTTRGNIKEVISDVFSFANERFFKGETLIMPNSKKIQCKVLDVIMPKKINQDEADEPNDDPSKNGLLVEPSQIKYVIETATNQKQTVKANQICRTKNLLTKDKIYIYIKLNCEISSDGIWRMVDESILNYNLDKMKFSEIFSGYPPKFAVTFGRGQFSKTNVLNRSLNQSLNKSTTNTTTKPEPEEKPHVDSDESEIDDNDPESQEYANLIVRILNKKVRDLNDEEFLIWRDYTGDDDDKELALIELEADKVFKREEKERERKRQIEEKKKQAELLKELKKPREDLECENLTELPKPIPIKSKLTQDMFGDAVMILEFLLNFGDLFELKADFPNGFNFNLLENALFSKSCDSALCNLLLFFLDSIFKCNDEETFDEINTESDSESVTEELTENNSEEISLENLYKTNLDEIADRETFAEMAEKFNKLIKNVQGKNMIRIGLDVYTISEMLRLYFLTSGCNHLSKIKFWYQQRGGYSRMDENGIDFGLNEKAILKKLEIMNVFELEPEEKLKILTCLCNQLMSHVRFRDVLEDNFSKMSQFRNQLRELQTEENRRVREEASERWKRKMQKKDKNPQDDEDEAKILLESTKKREEFLKKEKTILDEIHQLQLKYSMNPIGRDRYHRRYWLFKSIPGIYVEDDPSYELDTFVRQSPKKESKILGKENLFKNEPKMVENVQTKWGFFHTSESIEQLLELLSERGIRECELKQTLTDFKPRILEHIQKLNGLINSLTMSQEDIETSLKNCLKENVSNVLASNSYIQNSMPKKRGPKSKELKEQNGLISDSSTQLSNSNNFASISSQEYMENDLKEKLLELEEQILIGGLGHLKVDNRVKWRELIQTGHYDPSCENLIFGDLTRLSKEQTNSENFKQEINFVSSNLIESITPEIQLALVNNYAKILLQIEQSVDRKFLRVPLGDVLKTPDRKKKGDEQRYGVLLNWEKSLMSCTTLSQLFIHLQNLDESIAWTKSALNAKCKVCRKKGDHEHMVLCRICDRGYHFYCLRPALTSMPIEEWHCPDCRPKPTEKMPRKIRKTFNDDMYSDENSQINEDDSKLKTKNKRKKEDIESDDGGVESETEMDTDYFEMKKRPRNKAKNKIEDTNEESMEEDISDKKRQNRKRKLTDDNVEEKRRSGKNIASASSTSASSNGSLENGHKNKLSRSKSAKSVYCELSDENSVNGTDEEMINNSKRKRARTLEASPGSSTSTRNLETSERIKKVENILNDLFKHKDSWPFLKPVTKRQAPDYFEVISKPIDFSTIRKKIKSFEYSDYTKIIEDIRQVFENCRAYNEPGSDIYETGERVSNYFELEAEKAGLLDTKELASLNTN
ncbi:unnamed protein product [Brachionus calyciflorus]|uniref:Bromodomain adjacent to zinc finger domain protein 1A n=1 Tax=Brachionus calyciflorus TaxID=104777 RepID=A0A813NPB0_9BILA|nr:unnamed protein product [Brachionus calyciflorus]